MRIFAIHTQGETEWVVAETNIHALKFYLDEISGRIEDFDDDDFIEELEESKWDNLIVKDEDSDETWTFREAIEGLVKPHIIASTAY